MKFDQFQNAGIEGIWIMVSEHSLTTLFQTYTELDNPPIIELRNIDNLCCRFDDISSARGVVPAV
jgi:hypothetical protein